jgi:hypothetical protein
MATSYLTQADVDNYGHDVIDFAQRAAAQAVAPDLVRLQQETERLRQNQARQSRQALDQAVAMAVPNFREIDRDPRWHEWLRGTHDLSGRSRQQWLNDAVNHGDAARVIQFFRGFLQQAGAAGPHQYQQQQSYPAYRATAGGRPVYSRADIEKAHRDYMRGAYRGREFEYQKLSNEFIRAAREGRIADAITDLNGR